MNAKADVPAAEVRQAAFENGWKSAGRDVSELKYVSVPVAAGDFSTYAAAVAAEEPDCLYGGLSEATWPSMITALDGLGSSPRFYTLQGLMTSDVVDAFPEQTEGTIIAGGYPDLSAPVFDDYRAAIEEYGEDQDLDYNSLAGLGTWTAYVAFTKIVEGMTGEINNVTFLEATSNTSNLETGILPPVDFTQEWTGGDGQFPRIFNRQVLFGTVQDGKIVALDDPPLDVSNAFDGNPG